MSKMLNIGGLVFDIEQKENKRQAPAKQEREEPPALPTWSGPAVCRLGICDGSGWLIVERAGTTGADECKCRASAKGAA